MNDEAKQREREYDMQYKKDHYKRISLMIRQDSELLKRIQYALYVEKIPMNEFIRKCIERYLDEKEY